MSQLRVVLLTQDEPFFLADALAELLNKFPSSATIVGAVLFEPSPFGKKEGTFKKAYKTASVFGVRFLFHYTLKHLIGVLRGRPRVADVLRHHGITQIQLTDSINSTESLQRIGTLQPDLLVSIAGNEIFKKPLLGLAPKGCINLHSALLPKYRGLMPSFWVMRHGEKETGVSVFFVDEGIDSGPIVIQRKLDIGDSTLDDLITRSKKLGMQCIAEAITKIADGEVRVQSNDNAVMSYFTFPKRADVVHFLAAGKRFY